MKEDKDYVEFRMDHIKQIQGTDVRNVYGEIMLYLEGEQYYLGLTASGGRLMAVKVTDDFADIFIKEFA